MKIEIVYTQNDIEKTYTYQGEDLDDEGIDFELFTGLNLPMRAGERGSRVTAKEHLTSNGIEIVKVNRSN
ncbi:hypothetical protein [Sodalis sp. RH20]|uniref:hypothetical protein n=1 Tax=unclassified Sodalis (in: enterobacteria) TaxID=2636512 RepID=UPI0039B57F7F